ncbi:MAG: STAS domain-containing protein [Bacteroidales bacterium]|nr:STAS domain-containing protein [Bacteroidales bacterium]
MDVTINQSEGKSLVVLNGRIDTTNADQFLNDINPLMQPEAGDIDMDCSNMDYTSSQGLRMFLMLQKAVSSRKNKLVLRNMKPQVKEVFDITGFSNIITIE